MKTPRNSVRCRGFTLIELMLVIAIIGLLAAIAIPAYSNYVMRAKVSEGMVLLSDRKTAIAEYYQNNQTMPRFFEDFGWPERRTNSPFPRVFGFTSEIWDRVVVRRLGGGQRLEIRLRSRRIPEWNGRRLNLYLQVKPEAGKVTFRCHVNQNSFSQRWVPTSCREGRRNQWGW